MVFIVSVLLRIRVFSCSLTGAYQARQQGVDSLTSILPSLCKDNRLGGKRGHAETRTRGHVATKFIKVQKIYYENNKIY
jgi:hypothetical protein